MKFLLTGVFLLCLISVGSLSFAESDKDTLLKKITARMMAMADKIIDLSPEAWERLEPKFEQYFFDTNETDEIAKVLLLMYVLPVGVDSDRDRLYRLELLEYRLRTWLPELPLAELEAIEREHLLVAEKALDKLLGSDD